MTPLARPGPTRKTFIARPVHVCFVGAIGALILLACTTDYQKGVDDPNFGAPNALANERQPGPFSANTRSDGGSAGGGAGVPECVKSGGTVIDAGACTVSFKTDLLAAFGTANCQTAGSCHGGVSPPNQPRIDPGDAPAMWAEFSSFKLSNGKPYINPCSIDPAASSIACNVDNAAPCGTVMPPATGLPADVVAKIETWLRCGSPNN